MTNLYHSVTGTSGVLAISVESGYSMISANATVECTSTSLSLGDAISIDMGYDDAHQVVFQGFVKKKEVVTPARMVRLTCQDVLIRAVDFFLASDDPEAPLQFNNTQDRDLVDGLLSQCGLSTSSPQPSPSFTFGTNEDGARFNLQSVAEAIQFVCSVTGRICYADAGVVYYTDRKPYIVGGDTPIATWTTGNGGNIISIQRETSTQNTRNVVKVYGKNPLTARASATNPYLVVDQAAVIAHELLDTQEICDATASVNLTLMNRLHITHTIDMLGDASVFPRTVYHVTNTFTGSDEDVFVYRVAHAFGDGGFVTNVTATA